MSSEVPVIASDWSGYKETIIHEKTGFKVPTYWSDCNNESTSEFFHTKTNHLNLAQSVYIDNNKLIEYLTLLIEDEFLRKTLGKNAREHVINNYHWKPIIKQYENLWKELNQQAISTPNLQRESIFKSDYYNTFKHYPTSELKVTSFKINKTNIDEFINQHPNLNISKEILTQLLTQIETNSLNLKNQESKRHLMWLLKQDIIIPKDI